MKLSIGGDAEWKGADGGDTELKLSDGGDPKLKLSAGGDGELSALRISCSIIQALSAEFVGFMKSIGLPLGPAVYCRGGLGMSATMVGGGKLSTRWRGPGTRFRWLKVLKLLGVTILSLPGKIVSDPSLII